MKRLLITILLATSSCATADDLPSVTLGGALAALQHAHSTHDLAQQVCSVRPEQDIGWDFIEKQTKEPANSQPAAKASKMFGVLDAIRVARRRLFMDYDSCIAKRDLAMSLSLQADMNTLDDVVREVETAIFNQVLNLESAINYYKKQITTKN